MWGVTGSLLLEHPDQKGPQIRLETLFVYSFVINAYHLITSVPCFCVHEMLLLRTPIDSILLDI